MNQKTDLTPLSPNHQLFVDEYFRSGLVATTAYMKVYPNSSYEAAGVSAFDLLKKPKIQNAIQKKFNSLRNKHEIEIDEIISKVKSLIDRCEKDDDRHHLLKSLDQLSKLLGLYAPKKVEHINQTPIQINIIKPSQSKIQPIHIGKIHNKKQDEIGDTFEAEETD